MSGSQDGDQAPASEEAIQPTAFRPSASRARAKGPRIRVWPLLVVVALVVLAGAVWLMFTVKSVRLELEPAAESVTVEGGWLTPKLGGRYLLQPGAYTLVARKPGYRTLKQQFEVTDRQSQQYRFRLHKLPGKLSVSSKPVGAQVAIDGKARGATPLADVELAPGSHEVVVSAKRYRDARSEVQIEGGGVAQQARVTLEPLWARIAIDSKPPKAQVRIDGETVGTTPLTTEVLAGSHGVQLVLDGYKPWQDKLKVVAQKPQTLPTVALEKVDAQLAVRSTPAGASVTVDGSYRGQTPLELALAPGKSHKVAVSKAGFERASREISVDSGQQRSLELDLKPRLGEVRLITEPEGAQVRVDGVAKGDANQRLRLTSVAHQIEVTKAGYVAFKTKVTPRPGFPQEVKVTLKTQAQAKREATPQKITSAAGQVLRRVEPSSFTMGAPRREQGRRANEGLRDVKLTRPFYISVKEVTNRQFREFKAKHSSGIVGRVTLDLDNQPAVRVTWAQAARYCNWLSQKDGLAPAYSTSGGTIEAVQPPTTGYRLPTEAEWAWVARMAGRSSARKYPWGQTMPPPASSGNYADASASDLVDTTLQSYDDGYAATAPVGSFAPNPVGVYDLGGNAAEWTNDYYAFYPYANETPVDPMGPEQGQEHVIRGSSWQDASIAELRLSYRDYGDEARADVGFRIARYAEKN